MGSSALEDKRFHHITKETPIHEQTIPVPTQKREDGRKAKRGGTETVLNIKDVEPRFTHAFVSWNNVVRLGVYILQDSNYMVYPAAKT